MVDGALVKVARYLGLLFGGLFAGFMLGVLILELSLRKFDGPVYAQVRQVELDALDVLATATLVPAIIATVFVVIATARPRGRGFWLTLTALALLLLVFGTSLAINLPINSDQLTWNVQEPPADWAAVRDRWQVAHAVRASAAILAFGCLITGGASRRPSQGPHND